MHDTTPTVCNHLAPFLAVLIEQGSSAVHVDEDAWSNRLLNVALDKGPSFVRAGEMFTLPASVTLWFNDDPHHDVENGLSCRECKHALLWPQVEKQK